MHPPTPHFRANCLLVAVQPGKIRPILNVSQPTGGSFNDAVDEIALEKVVMTSPRRFSLSVLACGKGAVMTNFDMKDAYKNIPCKPEDFRLQGFEWGGRFFVETSQIFGAKTAVCNYDMLGNSVRSLTLSSCKIPGHLVHRQLNDVPLVGPKESGWCEEFTAMYESICEECGIKLAPPCPKNEKAFKNTTFGKVLGIEFNTEILSWRLPENKRVKYMNRVVDMLKADSVLLTLCQEVVGSLNFVCTMLPSLRTFKKPLQILMSQLLESEMSALPLSIEARNDLLFWWKFLHSMSWLPIAQGECHPPLHHSSFTSDAAG
jgi:hypothetical protein